MKEEVREGEEEDGYECPICCCVVEEEELVVLACRHAFKCGLLAVLVSAMPDEGLVPHLALCAGPRSRMRGSTPTEAHGGLC